MTSVSSPVNLAQILHNIWARRWLIVAVWLVVILLGCMHLYRATPKYTASMSLLLSTEQGSGGGSSGVSGLPSVFAGLRLGADASKDLVLFQQRMGTEAVAARVLEANPEIAEKLYGNLWDAEKEEWKKPKPKLFSISGALNRLAGMETWTTPGVKRFAGFVRGQISVSIDKLTGIMTLSFNHQDQEFALQVLQEVHRATEEITRADSIERTDQRIAYLRSRALNESMLEYRNTLFSLLMNEEKKRMMLDKSVPFYISVFSPATVTDSHTEPKPMLIFGICFVLGLVLGVFVALIIDALLAVRGHMQAVKHQKTAAASPQTAPSAAAQRRSA